MLLTKGIDTKAPKGHKKILDEFKNSLLIQEYWI
jgi:hypothetical protein